MSCRLDHQEAIFVTRRLLAALCLEFSCPWVRWLAGRSVLDRLQSFSFKSEKFHTNGFVFLLLKGGPYP